MTDDEKKQAHNEEFQKMSKEILGCYQKNLQDFLENKKVGPITDADVIIMIMNLTIGVSTNIYFSLKQYLPNSPIDYPFTKVKIINTLSDEFEKIKDYDPEKNILKITPDQVKEIIDNGFSMITLPDGSVKKVTKDDLLIREDDVNKLLKDKSPSIVGANSPKIIVPPERTH